MMTVVLASDEAAPFLEEYNMLFQPFVQEGKVAFCHWNRNGTDFRSAVPELRNIVRGHERWRALVVQPLPERLDGQTLLEEEFASTWDNPFDFLCNASPDAGKEVEESPVPMIRLAQMLGGVPEPIFDYNDEIVETPRGEVRSTVLSLSVEELEKQRRAWAKLEEKYRFLCDKPAELWLFTARRMDPLRSREKLPPDSDAARPAAARGFALRNRYPTRARFLTMDCSVPDHARCREDEFTFWMMVLTLALNRYEGGRLEPEKLYRIQGSVDTAQLQELFSHYYHRMRRVQKEVDHRTALLRARMEQNRDREELPDYKFTVPVKYREERVEGLTVSGEDVGLASDCPAPELPWWRSCMELSRRALARLLQGPRRALDMSCALARRNARMEGEKLCRLDQYQLDEMEMLLHEEEIEILCSDASGALPVRRFHRWRSAADQATRTNIGRRMTRRMAVSAGAVALAVYLTGFLPELIHALRQGADLAWMLYACGIRLGVVALAGLGALLFFRMGLINKIRDYNGVMGRIQGIVAASCNFFGNYLTQVCTYMRGRSVLDAMRGRSVLLQEGLHQMEKHRAAIARCCSRAEGWMRDFELDILPDMLQGKMEYFNSEIDPEENEVYDLRASREGYIRDSQGKQLLVPYPFVSSMEIRREELTQ